MATVAAPADAIAAARIRPRVVIAVLALLGAAAFALSPLAPAGAAIGTQVTLHLPSPVVVFGRALVAGGTITRDGTPVAGVAVELQLNRYPYRGFVVISSARSAADGSFSFTGVRPSRNAQVRVVEAGGAAARSAAAQVTVDPAVTLSARVLGRGRTLLTATAVHTRSFGSAPVDAYWYVAPRGSPDFQFVAVTKTREARPGVTTMSATVDPPARHFSFLVCFVPGWARAMGHPSARLPCRDHDFVARRPGRSSQ